MDSTDTIIFRAPSVKENPQEGEELILRVRQLEAEHTALREENKKLRFLLDRAIEHRQKSHSELVLLLTTLVSKLPINDVGVIVSRLVEHNARVIQYLPAPHHVATQPPLPHPPLPKTHTPPT